MTTIKKDPEGVVLAAAGQHCVIEFKNTLDHIYILFILKFLLASVHKLKTEQIRLDLLSSHLRLFDALLFALLVLSSCLR